MRNDYASAFSVIDIMNEDRTIAPAGNHDSSQPTFSLPPAAKAAMPATLPEGQAPPPADVPLPKIPGYEMLGTLGRGGMGVVYKARQVGLNRVVALKMILAGGYSDERERGRFLTEAETVARLHHPNIVQIHQIGEHDGLPYFSLEYCEGGSLSQRLNGAPLPPGDAAQVVRCLARAMHVAHEANIVHRDLKPANILLAAGDQDSLSDQHVRGQQVDRAGLSSCRRTAVCSMSFPRLPISAWPRSWTARSGKRPAAPSWARPATWPRSRPGRHKDLGPPRTSMPWA